MIRFVTGNILESSARCLVNTVNCEGYMGKGIAYQFKRKFPENNRAYVAACRSGKLRIGTIHAFEEDGKLIVNFPTKDRWRARSKMEYITIGMERLVEFLKRRSVKSLAVPPLGCGNGGLEWTKVKPVILAALDDLSRSMDIVIYEPSKRVGMASIKRPPKPTLSHLLLLQIRMGLKKPTRLRLQKTAYFFDVFAKERYFRFQRHIYGPYDHSIEILSRQIKELEDYYHVDAHGCMDLCKQQIISKQVEKRWGAFQVPMSQAIDFINRIISDSEMELLATVCYIVEEASRSEADIIREVQAWSERKRQMFSVEKIHEAIVNLYDGGIITRDVLGQFSLG